jgi:hypothetical protein
MRVIACLSGLAALPFSGAAFAASEQARLIVAISKCQIQATRQLLEAGADVNATDEPRLR